MTVLKVIVVDDEPLGINVLKNYIEQVKELRLLNTFSNAVETGAFLISNKVDIIFLDINMPIINGLDFLKDLSDKPLVIITSAHEEYALKSFELEVFDYLVKPFSFPRFLKPIKRILKLSSPSTGLELGYTERPHIFVKLEKKVFQKIYLDEILVVESLKDYIRIKTTTSKYIVYRTLGSFTEELPAANFVRIHRSYTVALDKINSVEANVLEIDGQRYIIGRSYVNEVKSRIFQGGNVEYNGE